MGRGDWTGRLLGSGVLFCLAGLIIILPVAHTSSVRAGFLILGLLLWAARMVRDRRLLIGGTPLDWPLALYLAAIVLSLFFSLKPEYSLSELRGEFLTHALLFYMAASSVRSDSDIETLAKVLLAASMVMGVYGIAEFFAHSWDPFSIEYRAGSLHQGYGAYAHYLVMVLPFNILAFAYRKRPGAWAALGALLIVNLAALFLTHMRGAWVAFWVELALIAALAIRGTALRLGAVAFIALAPLLALSVLPERTLWHGKSGLSLAPEERRNTVDERLVMWEAAVRELSEAPLAPAGYGKTNFMRRFSGPEFAGFEQAHNSFLNAATQLGAQGLAALLAVIFMALRMGWGAWRRARTALRSSFALGAFVMTAGFFTANQFADFYIDDTAQMFWILTGLCAAAYRLDREGDG